MKKHFSKLGAVLVLIIGLFFVSAGEVSAARFTNAVIRYNRMMTGVGTTVQVIFTPTTVGSEAKVRLVFESATPGAVPVVDVTNIGTGVTALPGTLAVTKVGDSSFVVTGVTDLTVGAKYAFNVANVTNPAAGDYQDQVATLTSGDAVIDSSIVTTRIITNDQVVITANVPPTFSFSLSANLDAFTLDLDSAAVRVTSGIGVSIATNAAKGWIGWIKSANSALSSITTGESIATSGTVDGTPSTCSAGSDCYVVDANITTSGTGAGSLTIDPEYNGVAASSGGALGSVLVPFASRSGKTNGDLITLLSYASITAGKAAGNDYTDTWTVVGAGNF